MRNNACSLFFTAAYLLLISSCSLQKKISKQAKQDILLQADFISAHVGISLYDPATGQYLYNYQGDKSFIPASNMKLFTCYAAMKNLGDSLVGIRYQLINDTLVEIEPSADPTLLHPDFKSQPVFAFLKKYNNIKIVKPRYEDYMGSGWSWNDFGEGYMAQRSNLPLYGNVVVITKKPDNSISLSPAGSFKTKITQPFKNGFTVHKSWDENVFSFSDGTNKSKEVPFRPDWATIETLLRDTLQKNISVDFSTKSRLQKIIYSQPTDTLLKIMMHRSDNFFAEQALLMVSNEKLAELNDAMIIDTLLKTDMKGLPQKPRWVDGSGLSRYNLVSPQDFVWVLTQMKNEFKWARIQEILPTGGEGTLSSYYKNYTGRIYAKTGSLSNHIALSGYLTTNKGKQLIFSVLVNAHQAPVANIRKGVEKFLTAIIENY